MKNNPIICALDMPSLEQAKDLAFGLKGNVGAVKLGLEFFLANGIAGVETIAESGIPIFLDLKLHDIPNTVAGAIRSVANLNPMFLTIHTFGGGAMMKKAVETVEELGLDTIILGVTVLTSMDNNELNCVGVNDTPQNQVLRLAKLAKEQGMKGLVCSPQEISIIRENLGEDITLVTPGIRPAGASVDDQSRIMTPKQAVDTGTNYMVIGRPITQAKDPIQATKDILKGFIS